LKLFNPQSQQMPSDIALVGFGEISDYLLTMVKGILAGA